MRGGKQLFQGDMYYPYLVREHDFYKGRTYDSIPFNTLDEAIEYQKLIPNQHKRIYIWKEQKNKNKRKGTKGYSRLNNDIVRDGYHIDLL